jgi:hypothetical protein
MSLKTDKLARSPGRIEYGGREADHPREHAPRAAADAVGSTLTRLTVGLILKTDSSILSDRSRLVAKERVIEPGGVREILRRCRD